MLAYINPQEAMMLKSMGGTGQPGPGGIPAFAYGMGGQGAADAGYGFGGQGEGPGEGFSNPANDPNASFDAFGDTYGKLYNWYAIAGIYDEASLNDDTLRKEFAPEGYHVPTNQEQTDLKVHLGSDINGENIGYKLKSTGNTSDGTGLWSGSQPATNESGWTGLPAGIRNGGVFMQVHDASIFWSSEAQTSTLAYMNLLHSATNAMQNGAYNIDRACSVRLIKE
jgi:uncharacterized protein (TIGR02145 family)